MCNFMVTIWNTGKDHFFFFTLENRYIDRPIAVIRENYFGHMKFSKLHLQRVIDRPKSPSIFMSEQEEDSSYQKLVDFHHTWENLPLLDIHQKRGLSQKVNCSFFVWELTRINRRQIKLKTKILNKVLHFPRPIQY